MPKKETTRLIQLLAAIVLWSCIACGTPTEPGVRIQNGWWTSSSGFGLYVQQGSASLAAGCGHGSFPLPTPRRDGTFEADGTFGFQGGPPPQGGASYPPARFVGQTDGIHMTLTIQRSGSAALGPFSFDFDGPQPKKPLVPPCP